MKSGYHLITVLTVCVVFVIAHAVEGGLGDPCSTKSDCEARLICQDDGICGCRLGHLDGVCLDDMHITKLNDTCHLDEQCFQMLGNHSVCHHGDGDTGIEGKCGCPEKWTLATHEEHNECGLACESDEDCQGHGVKGMEGCGAWKEGADVKVCQPRAAAEPSTGEESKKGMSGGAIFGVVLLIGLIGVLIGFGVYHRRQIMERLARMGI